MFKKLFEALVHHLPAWLTRCFNRDVKERLDSLLPVDNQDSNAANDSSENLPVYGPWLPHGKKRKLVLRDPDCMIHGRDAQRQRDEEEERLFQERLFPNTGATVELTFTDGDSTDDPMTWPLRGSSLQAIHQEIAAAYQSAAIPPPPPGAVDLLSAREILADGRLGASFPVGLFGGPPPMLHGAQRMASGSNNGANDDGPKKSKKQRREDKKAKQKEEKKYKKKKKKTLSHN